MLTIEIVEDEPLEQNFIKSIVLEEQSLPEHMLYTCESGTQAIKLAKQHRPDIIFMDILIPELDGLSAIQEIRKFLPDASIAILSACSDFSYAQKAINLRVFEYLLKPVKPAALRQLFRRMLETVAKNKENAEEEIEEPNTDHPDFIEESLKYIQDNFREKLTLQAISSYVFMNPQYFSRVFKKQVGITCTNYVNKLKIAYACKLLEKTDYTAYRISSECGFTDPSYFNRVFFQQMKMTPKEYKKNACMEGRKS